MPDIVITPASANIVFSSTANAAAIRLDTSTNTLVIEANGGVQLGNTASDVYIGDGVNNIDIVYEQDGDIRALGGKTLTVGQANSYVVLAGQTSITGVASLAGGLTVTGTANLTGGATVTGTVNVSGRITAANGTFTGLSQLRLKTSTGTSSYAVIHRNDGSNYFMLLTNNNDADGEWNDLRPFSVSLSGGTVTLANTTVSGRLTVTTNTATFGTAAYILANGNFGVGTSAPERPISSYTGTEWAFLNRGASDTNSNRNAVFLCQRARGSIASPTAVTADCTLGGVEMGGYNGSAYTYGWNGGAAIFAYAEATWNVSSNPTYISLFTTPSGAATPAERIRVASNGNVGIGNTTPTNKLRVQGDITTVNGIHLGGTQTYNENFLINDYAMMARMFSGGDAVFGHNIYSDPSSRVLKQRNAGYYAAWIRMYYNGGIYFGTSTAAGAAGDTVCNPAGTTNEKMVLTNAGKLGIGTTTFNTNGGVLQVADGISFPATQSACSDGNTLDDYEEGTWTPELRDGATVLTQGYSYRSGVYHKIGRMVHIHFGFLLSSLSGTSTNALRVYGLPFTGATTGGYQEPMGYAILGQQPTAADANEVYFFIGSGQAYLEGRKLNGSDTVYTSNQIDGDTFCKFSAIYWV